MIHLIPAVKYIETYDQPFPGKALCYPETGIDSRLLSALKKLPYDKSGVPLEICIDGEKGEGYKLTLSQEKVAIRAESEKGAFYAIQTLRQIFRSSQIPCLTIKDHPDFEHRGFYHDVTRGKIPTMESIKALIDDMAYYKLNSLQLYVEHTFAFREYFDLNEKTGFLSKDELLEIGAYCKENFIDFIPSLSTFGHLYELLQLPRYQHLRVLKDYQPSANFWHERMQHHTIDPESPESIALIKSLIDQYLPCFESEWFNICCDETFDLKTYDENGIDSGALYVAFVKKIVSYVQKQGKKVMMWGDILLKHPEVISQLPDDVCFLNWSYVAQPKEENIRALSGKTQIVCPGTTSWSRLCENVDVEESNISRMAQYGHRYGAWGVLNTNWGDWANPCSLELGMYGMVLGAEKSWSVDTPVDDTFYSHVNALLYAAPNGILYLKELSHLQDLIDWNAFCATYFAKRYGGEIPKTATYDVGAVQTAYRSLASRLSAEKWAKDEYRQEMLLAAEGICVMAELLAKLLGKPVTRLTDTSTWLQQYCEKWLQKNKPSELYNIREMFRYCEDYTC